MCTRFCTFLVTSIVHARYSTWVDQKLIYNNKPNPKRCCLRKWQRKWCMSLIEILDAYFWNHQMALAVMLLLFTSVYCSAHNDVLISHSQRVQRFTQTSQVVGPPLATPQSTVKSSLTAGGTQEWINWRHALTVHRLKTWKHGTAYFRNLVFWVLFLCLKCWYFETGMYVCVNASWSNAHPADS